MASLGFWRIAERRPDWVALVDEGGTRYPADELLRRVNRLSSGLRALGLTTGDAVAVVLPNVPGFVETNLAATQIGLYLVPINWHFTAPEIGYILSDCAAKAVVTHPRFAATVASAAQMAGIPARARLAVDAAPGFRLLDELAAGQPDSAPPDRAAGSVMHYTSGTTGRPKGVRRPLGEFSPDDTFELLTALPQIFGVEPENDNVHLVSAPFYHTAASLFGMGALHLGHTLVLMDKWSAEGALARIDRHRVTNTHMVPIHFNRMLALPEEVKRRYDTSSMRWLIHAAAPCPIPIKQAMLDWFGPCVYEYYAATEGGGTIATPQDWLSHPGTVGLPWPTSDVKVVDTNGAATPTGVPGTVYMRMIDSIDFEYAGDPEKTRASRHDGYFTVGDIGYFDADGFLYLCDRKADMIISGGANIYPAEIENELLSHPKVADVAVFGIPDPEWGEQVKAVVEPAADVPPGEELEAELLAYLEGRIAKMKWPRSVDFIAEMPRDPSGKLRKRELREPYWRERDTAI